MYFDKYRNELSEENKSKIHTNPLRILDTKNSGDRVINKNAPKISDYYSEDAKCKFNNMQILLTEASINFQVNPSLVRGLDYYCHTVFEFKSNDLGTQDTLIGGGRYDGLTKVIGGPDIPGVGWAGGVERLIMLMQEIKKKEKKVYLILLNENFKNYGLKLLNLLRKNNIPVYFDFKYNLKKSLSSANYLNYEYAIIIGEDEINNNACTIKNLFKNSQETVSFEQTIKTLN